MNRSALHWLRRSLVAVAAVTFVTACAADNPVEPTAAPAAPEAGVLGTRDVDLGTCDSLKVGQENKLKFRAYATGVQIYRWSGTSWAFVAPEATLFANANGTGKIGTHYAGPTWGSNSGSKVVAA